MLAPSKVLQLLHPFLVLSGFPNYLDDFDQGTHIHVHLEEEYLVKDYISINMVGALV